MNIALSETQDSAPIEILNGADMAGRLYNDTRHVLRSGLIGVGIFLVRDTSITELWELNVLGIKDFTKSKSFEKMTLAAKNFLNKLLV